MRLPRLRVEVRRVEAGGCGRGATAYRASVTVGGFAFHEWTGASRTRREARPRALAEAKALALRMLASIGPAMERAAKAEILP
jgi:hypothetical protein